MARLPRISPVDIPVHIIQRGNNRQVCFAAEDDYAAYVGWLTEYAKKYKVDVHAWVLMANHEYQRSGTLWGGRYKSCLIQEEMYLLEVYRCIELNPVRAELIADPGEYRLAGE